jgi:hypothetical protein
MSAPKFEIPKECKAGVVYNEGPNFELKVEMVPVPEPGSFTKYLYRYRRREYLEQYIMIK